MQIEAGKYYRDTDGVRVGPMVLWNEGADNCWSWDRDDGDWIYKQDGTSDYNPTLVAEWPDEGPVRTVTRREIIPGEYGQVRVGKLYDVPNCNNPDEPPQVEIGIEFISLSMGSDQLEAAARTLQQLAEALRD